MTFALAGVGRGGALSDDTVVVSVWLSRIKLLIKRGGRCMGQRKEGVMGGGGRGRSISEALSETSVKRGNQATRTDAEWLIYYGDITH